MRPAIVVFYRTRLSLDENCMMGLDLTRFTWSNSGESTCVNMPGKYEMARVPSQSNGQCVLQGVGRSSRFVEMCMTTGTRMTKSRLEGSLPWRWLAFQLLIWRLGVASKLVKPSSALAGRVLSLFRKGIKLSCSLICMKCQVSVWHN